jgi:predicted nucleotidyltransferase
MKETPSAYPFSESIRVQIAALAERHQLLLVCLYGSQAQQKTRPESDLDIAILGKRRILSKAFAKLSMELAEIFQRNDVDVKSLHRVSPLFRYQAMKNSILLYGTSLDYERYKLYAFRDYQDSRSLLKLRDQIIERRLAHAGNRTH